MSVNLRSHPYWALLPFAVFLVILPFPGTVALRLVCLVAAFSIAVLTWRRLAPPRIPVMPALLVWIAICILSLANAVDSSYSLGEIKNEIGYAMLAFIAFFAVTRELWTLRLWSRLVVAAATGIGLFALAVVAGTGYWDLGGGHTGVGAYASLVVAAGPLMLLAGLAQGRWRWIGVTAAVTILAASFVSEQRIVWIAFGLQFVAAIILFRRAGLISAARNTVIVIVAASLALAVAVMLGTHALKTVQSSPDIQAIGKDFRLEHWSRVLSKINEHPVLGAGFGRETMKKAYPDLVPTTGPQTLLWHPHNVFLTYGIAMGWPGMLALLALFLSLCREYWRQLRRPRTDVRLAAIVGIMLVIGVVTRNMTNDFFLRDGALLFWALQGALLGFLSRPDPGVVGAS